MPPKKPTKEGQDSEVEMQEELDSLREQLEMAKLAARQAESVAEEAVKQKQRAEEIAETAQVMLESQKTAEAFVTQKTYLTLEQQGMPGTPVSHDPVTDGAAMTDTHGKSRYPLAVPLPRQMLFDGKTPWEAFIRPFEAQAVSCRWEVSEKLFRLTNSLRGDAAEFVYCQLTAEVVNSYKLLSLALEARFKERHAAKGEVCTRS